MGKSMGGRVAAGPGDGARAAGPRPGAGGKGLPGALPWEGDGILPDRQRFPSQAADSPFSVFYPWTSWNHGPEWAAAADALPAVVCVAGSDGLIRRVNRTAVRWGLCSDPADAVGTRVDAFFHPDCEGGCRLAAWLQQCVQGEGASGSLVLETAGRAVELHVAPLAPGRAAGPALLLCAVDVSPHGARVQACGGRRRRAAGVAQREAELARMNALLRAEIEEHQRTEAALRRSESELRLSSAQLLTAQEMERKRIATDLHDSIGQSLTGLLRSIESLAAGGGAGADPLGALQAMVPRVRDAIGELRRIAMDLRPATLDDLGLLPTVSWFLREFRQIHRGLRVHTDIDLEEADAAPRLKTAIFRVLQEALNNVVKHAGADAVQLALKRRGRCIELAILDNGRGFDGACTRAGGLGLRGMRERTELAGGQFTVESAPGAGTRIVARWPLPR